MVYYLSKWRNKSGMYSAIDNNRCDPVVWWCVYCMQMCNQIGKMYFVRELMENKRHEAAETTPRTGSSWFYFTDKYVDERNKSTYCSPVLGLQKTVMQRNYKFDMSLVSIFPLIRHCDPFCLVQSHRFPFDRWTITTNWRSRLYKLQSSSIQTNVIS